MSSVRAESDLRMPLLLLRFSSPLLPPLDRLRADLEGLFAADLLLREEGLVPPTFTSDLSL